MPEPAHFVYGAAELEYLRAKDKKLGAAIEKIGLIKRQVNPHLFSALINSIVGQQISTKAQVTIWGRLQERFSPFTPETLANSDPDQIQTCGLSMRKAVYIKEASQAILTGEIDLESLKEKQDQQVIEELVKLRGVGVWTAEMLLTFSLQRPDIVSYGDLAIRRGMRMLYRHLEITPSLFEKYRRRYSPYGTTASLYLWAIAGDALPELDDPKLKLAKK